LTDDGVEGALFQAGDDALVDFGELFRGGAEEGDAADIGLAEHDIARVDLDGARLPTTTTRPRGARRVRS